MSQRCCIDKEQALPQPAGRKSRLKDTADRDSTGASPMPLLGSPLKHSRHSVECAETENLCSDFNLK
jgi:hypothetical protein